MTEQTEIMQLTADIVTAFVSNNIVHASDLSELISTIHDSLTGITAPKPAEEPALDLKPAVAIRKSVTDDYIVSLEDGRRFKSMKRYLAGLGMTPDQYRTKWGLPRDYPMVAPGYTARRSELAKAAGLGSGRRQGASTIPEAGTAKEPIADAAPVSAPVAATAQPEAAVAPARRRGRPKKVA